MIQESPRNRYLGDVFTVVEKAEAQTGKGLAQGPAGCPVPS